MARINSTSITYASPTVVHSHQSTLKKKAPGYVPRLPTVTRSPVFVALISMLNKWFKMAGQGRQKGETFNSTECCEKYSGCRAPL